MYKGRPTRMAPNVSIETLKAIYPQIQTYRKHQKENSNERRITTPKGNHQGTSRSPPLTPGPDSILSSSETFSSTWVLESLGTPWPQPLPRPMGPPIPISSCCAASQTALSYSQWCLGTPLQPSMARGQTPASPRCCVRWWSRCRTQSLREMKDFLNRFQLPQFNQDQINYLNGFPVENKTKQNNSPKPKHPGSDGFGAEFYQTFKEELIPSFWESFDFLIVP